MEKAIIKKEWIKTWRLLALCVVISLAMAIYALLRMNRLIELKGAEHLWLIMLLKDNSFVDVVKWTPVICGLIMGLGQMLPEMTQKRLKLTLHLPYPQQQMMVLMLMYGIIALLAIDLLQALVIGVYVYTILPTALVGSILTTMLPWFFAGLVAYLFTAAICIEGRRIRRCLLALVGIAFVMVFYEQTAMSAYRGIILISILFICLLLIVPLGSVVRFKEGLQD